jgi:chromatin remodeling complex protein RSC6
VTDGSVLPVETEVDANASTGPVAAVVVTIDERLDNLNEELGFHMNTMKEELVRIKKIQSIIKSFQKDVVQMKKDALKKRGGGRKSNLDANGEVREHKPSGFAKPTLLSKELCAFLNVPEDTMLPRTQVTRKITDYVKENKLYNETDKRTIVADDVLIKLLNLSSTDTLTYFNLQTHMKHHFMKSVAPVAEPVVQATA